jgi:Cu(I)/Ag(I) efflux system membrane fusion protein
MRIALPLFLLAWLSAAPALAAEPLGAVVDAYLRIQRALADDALEPVKPAAEAIAAKAGALGEAGRGLQQAAGALARARDLAGAREAFGTLSDALLAYARSARVSLGEGVRIAYCPMVDKSWVQKGRTIANPYGGRSMQTCGEFKGPA